MTLHLYDPGDVGATLQLQVYGPENSSGVSAVESFHLALSAAGGSGFGPDTSIPWTTLMSPWWLTPCNTPGVYPTYGTACPDLGSPAVNGPIVSASGGSSFANGVWLQITVPVDKTYSPTAPDDWWKMNYDLTGCGSTVPCGHDVTTWQIASSAAPVHLIEQD